MSSSRKKAFLVERLLTPEETEGFLALLRQQEATVYISVPHEALQRAGALEWPGLTPPEIAAVNQQLLTSINVLGHTQAGKDTVAGFLSFRGFPTWYYHKFRINFGLQAHLQQAAAYNKVMEQYDLLVVYTQQVPDPLLVPQNDKIRFVTGGPQIAKKAGTKPFSSLLLQLRKMSQRFLSSPSDIIKSSRQPRHLFVLNHSHVRPILDPDQLPEVYEDNAFAGYFLKEYAEHFVLLDKLLLEKGSTTKAIGLVEDAKTKSQLQTGYFGRNMLHNEWVEARALIKPKILWQLRKYGKHLKKGYKKINKALSDPLHRLIMQEFIKLHSSSLYFHFIFLAYRSFFKTNIFESVTLLDEYSPNFRAIIDAAKSAGVRTQAIQHGSLAAANPGYGYSTADERFNPWPDRTLVWGSFWKELLIDIAAYPPDRLYICGQLRTDIIPPLKEAQLESVKILGAQTKDKFLILLATQPQPDENLRRRAALDTFSVAKNLPDAWVLVKPHPRETDLEYYRHLAAEAGCTNYSFHYETDLFLLLRLSHVLVHCYSTVGIEAVYFGLPAIILDYLQQDILKFAAEEVALQALNPEQLEAYLLQIKRGEWQLAEAKRQAYIQTYACAIDGKVSERTAQALLSAEAPANLL